MQEAQSTWLQENMELHSTVPHVQAKFKSLLTSFFTKLTLSTFFTSISKYRVVDTQGKKPIEVSTNDKLTMMLEKQKTHSANKEKAQKGVGKEIMKELHLKSSVEYKGLHIPPKPPRVCGYMMKIGKVLGGKNRRYFEMNPIEGNLIKYKSKQDCPKDPTEIYGISEILGLTRLPAAGTQKFHFFEVLDKALYNIGLVYTQEEEAQILLSIREGS